MQFSGVRAFIVDDEPVIASSLAAILSLHGFTASFFTDPLKALASALLDPPDLLISDIVMPNLSGIDLALQIKALCPGCRVLLFSGQATNVDFLQDAHKVDSNLHIIPKPVHPSTLLEIIRQQSLEN